MRLKYIGCTDEQVKFGNHDDPRGILIEGAVYGVEYTEVHTWHTRIKLRGIEGEFNSVCFEEFKDV